MHPDASAVSFVFSANVFQVEAILSVNEEERFGFCDAATLMLQLPICGGKVCPARNSSVFEQGGDSIGDGFAG